MKRYKDLSTFFNMTLDDDQIAYRDAIMDPEKLIIFADARAGTGKTTIATACAYLLYEQGLYDGITYIASPTQEQKQGYLKGTIEEKSEPYFSPFYEALDTIGVNRNTSMANDINNLKNGTGFIECITHTFSRGTNLKRRVVIIDESQNFYKDELKKVLTRIHDDCKVIVIGHSGQIDLYKNPERSGFIDYLHHYEGDSRVAICKLSINHRGWISTHADELV